MATPEQIEEISIALSSSHPKALFRAMDETQAGIGAVLRLLSESEGTVTAGKIADFMNVSTARVAVLLKKMAAKDLIIKESYADDARVTVVRLSPKGVQTAANIRNNMHTHIGAVIDKVGMERLLEFVDISRDIRTAMNCPPPEL